MKNLLFTMFFLVFTHSFCGGGGGGVDVQDDNSASVDIQDSAEILEEEASDGDDGGGGGDGEIEEEEIVKECTKDEECAYLIGNLVQCKASVCNLETFKCEIKSLSNDSACDDGNLCTINDKCSAGVCGGEQICECKEDSDCAIFDDEDLCNGFLVCDISNLPYKCVIDPLSIVECDKTNDTDCLENKCKPEDGLCYMTAVNEGGDCVDEDPCSLDEKCSGGECKGTAEFFCDDGNPCTDDKCVSGKGCEFTNNDSACSDNDMCTDGDRCENGECVSGAPVECDNGIFCDGAEWCDKEKGCQKGDVPDCSDNNPCTEDFCDSGTDKCVNLKFSWAKEGAFGSDSCSDTMDNDCDSLIDGNDPQCGFQIIALFPSFGTDQGGEEVLITGGSLTLVKTVKFGDASAEFTVISDDEIIAITPEHAAGDVDIIISDGEVSFILNNGFRFSALSENPELFARLNAPLEETVNEEEETEALRGEFSDNNLTLTSGNGDKIIAQIGYGERGTNPHSHGSWKWLNATLEDDTSGKYFYKATLKIKNGGYFDYAFRFSTDSALTFVYGDSGAGSSDGYDPDKAGKLTVYGVPDPGEVVVNELMWMGSNSDPWDEWFELRNMTKAPVILSGWMLTGAGVLGADFLLDDNNHIVNNIIIEPEGYFLVAEYDYDKSAVASQPDIVGVASLVLTNTPPMTYYLKDASGKVIDEVFFSGNIGFNGDDGGQEKSMERVKSAGAGNDDKNWFTAFHSRGFKGDPFQKTLFGSPRYPNSDIPECESDDECADFLPVAIPQCSRWSCDAEILKCVVAPKEDASPCDDGLFCTVNDICIEGECQSGLANDCSDENQCTEDKCDEESDKCVNEWLPTAVEGPSGSETCSDSLDNDCDGQTDADDQQCLLGIVDAIPDNGIEAGGTKVKITGSAFQIVKEVYFGVSKADFTLIDSSTIIATTPPGNAGYVDIILKDGAVSAILEDGFRYTGVATGFWGNYQWPETITFPAGGESETLYGQVWVDGITNSLGDPSLIIAEVGIGPVGSDPALNPEWMWFGASYNPECSNCGENYEYMGKISSPSAGSYIAAFRYSIDGGFNFLYGDKNGSDDGFDPNLCPPVTVTE